MERQTGAIRLTNKTALALRKSARQERTLAYWTMGIVTVALSIAAVLAGIRWLPAVPMLIGLAVLLDAALFVRGRSRYLSLTGQAICAEAAARQMRTDKAERDRQTQALQDLMDAKADIPAYDAAKARETARARRKRPANTDPDLEPEENWTTGEETDNDPDLRPPEEKKPKKTEGPAATGLRYGNDGKRQSPFEQIDRFPEKGMTDQTIVHRAGKPFEEGKRPALDPYASADTRIIRPVERDREGGYAQDERATDKTIVRQVVKPVRREEGENPPVVTGKTIEMPRVRKEEKGEDLMTEHRRRRQAALKVLLPENNADTN